MRFSLKISVQSYELSKFSNLTSKPFTSAGISSRDRNCKGKFQLFKLVATFKEILVVARHDFARRCGIGG